MIQYVVKYYNCVMLCSHITVVFLQRGDRPLLYAVRRGSEDMVKFLVEKGAYVNVVDWVS